MWWITLRTPEPVQLKVSCNCPKYTVLGGVQRPPIFQLLLLFHQKSTIIPVQGDVFSSPGGLRGNEMSAWLLLWAYWSCDPINLWALPPYTGYDFSKVVKVKLRFDGGEYLAAWPNWILGQMETVAYMLWCFILYREKFRIILTAFRLTPKPDHVAEGEEDASLCGRRSIIWLLGSKWAMEPKSAMWSSGGINLISTHPLCAVLGVLLAHQVPSFLRLKYLPPNQSGACSGPSLMSF